MRPDLRRTGARLPLQHGISKFDSLNDAQPCQIHVYVRAGAYALAAHPPTSASR